MADEDLPTWEYLEKYAYRPPRISPANFAGYSATEITRDLKRRVHGRFSPDHAVIYEVPLDGRRIDVVAVGRAPHTKYKVHGFEIKTSRTDLMNELYDRAKSAPARRVCDRWWLVLPDARLFAWKSELPAGWGILVAAEQGLRTIAEPEPIQAERTPDFTSGLVTAALNSHNTCVRVARQNGYRAGYKQCLADGKERGGADNTQRRVVPLDRDG